MAFGKFIKEVNFVRGMKKEPLVSVVVPTRNSERNKKGV